MLLRHRRRRYHDRERTPSTVLAVGQVYQEAGGRHAEIEALRSLGFEWVKAGSA